MTPSTPSIQDVVQAEGSLSQREAAERAGLSQNACWRRMQRLVRRPACCVAPPPGPTPARIRARVAAIAEVVELHRIGGEWDYFLKVVTPWMAGYDAVYRQLIAVGDLETVTGHFSMEAKFDNRPSSVRITA